MSSERRDFLDIWYSAVRSRENEAEAFSYRLYAIRAQSKDGVLFDDQEGNSTDDLSAAEVFASGFVKFDGCSNWIFKESEDGSYTHACTRQQLVNIGEALARCWDWEREVNPDWWAEK